MLQAKLKKCEFGQPQVKYLGHIVGSGEVHMDQDKAATVANWEVATDIKGVQQFLGFANHNNRFIPDFAKVAAVRLKLKGYNFLMVKNYIKILF